MRTWQSGVAWISLGIFAASLTPWVAGAQESDLAIANRYFSQKKKAAVRQELRLFSSEVASGGGVLERLRPRGYAPGETWRVRLSLKHPPVDAATPRQGEFGEIVYQVLEWSGFPESKLVLRLESPHSAGSPGSYVEHRLFFRRAFSEIRRCEGSGVCSPWSSVSSQTLRLAGEDHGLGWEHGPVAMPADSFMQASVNSTGANWESEDFFGRAVQWTWSAGDPWPARMESPQGIAVLIAGGAER